MRQKIISILSLFFISGLFLAGCELMHCDCYCSEYDAEVLKLNETVDLRYNEWYCNSIYEFRLSFDSILDSRCPIGAECIWEGNGSVKLHLQQSGRDPVSFWLNTNSNFLTDTTINGLHYSLVDLLPYPEVDKEYQLNDYTLQLHITD